MTAPRSRQASKQPSGGIVFRIIYAVKQTDRAITQWRDGMDERSQRGRECDSSTSLSSSCKAMNEKNDYNPTGHPLPCFVMRTMES